MSKEEIIEMANAAFTAMERLCNRFDEPSFFEKRDSKWSVAENLQHLILSTNITTLAYRLPKFMLKIIAGKPNRPSMTFDEMLIRYNLKLAAGATASNRYVPKPLAINAGKEKLLLNWGKSTQKFILALQQYNSEKDLDNYMAKHPLLGKITLRELCYFTIFHTNHHYTNIQKLP